MRRLKPSPKKSSGKKMKTFRKRPLKNLKKAKRKRKRENLFPRILRMKVRTKMKQKNWI